MRAAPAAVAALLTTAACLTACGSDAHAKPADQSEVCAEAIREADLYVWDIRTNLDLARQPPGGAPADPSDPTFLAKVNADVRQWRLSTAQMESKDITPDLRAAMDTLVTRLKPLESQTTDTFAPPPTPDSTMEVYQAKLKNQLCT